MRKLVSTHLFRRQRLQAAHLKELRAAGAEGVELFCSRGSFDYRQRAQVEEICGGLESHGLALHSLHSPIYADERDGRSGEPPLNIADPEPRRRIEAMDEIQRALEVAEHVPCRFLVQHLGPSKLEWSARQADHALGSLERLRIFCKERGVTLLVENIPNGLSTPAKLIAFLESNHLDDVGICFDSGHAHLSAELFGGGDELTSWDTLAARVRSTHLHDNNGSADEHLWPGQGTIAWPELARRLTAAGPKLSWLIEVGDLPTPQDAYRELREAWAKLERWADAATIST